MQLSSETLKELEKVKKVYCEFHKAMYGNSEFVENWDDEMMLYHALMIARKFYEDTLEEMK